MALAGWILRSGLGIGIGSGSRNRDVVYFSHQGLLASTDTAQFLTRRCESGGEGGGGVRFGVEEAECRHEYVVTYVLR